MEIMFAFHLCVFGPFALRLGAPAAACFSVGSKVSEPMCAGATARAPGVGRQGGPLGDPGCNNARPTWYKAGNRAHRPT